MNREERKSWYYEQIHKIIDDIIYKQCSQCKEWFPETIEYFYMRNKSKPERGFNSECKECSREKAKNYQRGCKEEQKERFNEWYLKNQKRNYERGCKWKENNKEYYTEIHKQWLNDNKDKVKEYNEKRLHKKHKINKNEWKYCKEYFYNSCAYCGLSELEHRRLYKEDLHREHVDHEGANDLSNCVPACKKCNSSKHKAILEEWYNINNPNFTDERYNKIMKWINEDYKQYIQPPKPKQKYTRKIKEKIIIQDIS